MAQQTKNTSPQKRTVVKDEGENIALWKRHGLEDVYFQREAQVNFWTVLGGIAVAALLTQITNLVAEFQAGRWYLIFYGLAAIMLIATSWVQNLWGSIILKMQVSYLYVILWLLNMVGLSVACLYVTKPAVFLAASAAVVMFTLLFQVYLMKSGAWAIFPAQMIKGLKTTLWIYLLIMLLCCGAAVHLFWYPSVPVEAGWGIFALSSSSGAVVMHNSAMKKERKEFGIP